MTPAISPKINRTEKPQMLINEVEPGDARSIDFQPHKAPPTTAPQPLRASLSEQQQGERAGTPGSPASTARHAHSRSDPA